ncbi:hypothetical protein V6N11_083441 [Hibiscus sabdariffa]|uniref:Uncharacterized protein n=1 Tax=Hibiscus sabdariffa TaxID=183260 RepID=A0ABR2QLV5_9ROSI
MELSTAVDLITGKVVSVIENEASLLTEVGAEIDEIKLELNAMKAFLNDADRRSGVEPTNETDSWWVANVRDIAYEVEDVDKVMYHFSKQQQWRGKLSRFFVKLVHFPKNLLVRRQVAFKLHGINKRIKSIAERNQRYRGFWSESRKSNQQIGGGNHSNNWVKNLSESSLFLKDDDIVGIDKAQRELLGWLMDQELQRTVTSVVDMGGLGKTTLLANTFNKQVVKQHFDCCAWVTVSQQYVVTELFKSMIKELYGKVKEKIHLAINLDSMSYRELVEVLVNFLQPRRYLIVIDDVWSTEFWQDINIALPANMNGSRILLTTRKENVASFEFGAANHIHRLQPLPFDESLSFFCKKAFVGKGGQCPPYLVSSARKLVAKSEGLPLAIVALGGLMASKNSIAEWNQVYNNLNQELSENDTVHISKSVKFVAKSYGTEEVEDIGIHRWSIEAKEKEMKAASKAAISRVRSLFVFAVDETSKTSFNRLPSGFKLMRVLDLEDAPINELPDELVNLFNLRYLNLSRTRVKELPKDVRKLYNLQFLELKMTQIKELPAGIVKLENLGHLIAYHYNVNSGTFDYVFGTIVPSNVCLLNNLHALSFVEARGDFIKQLSKMTQLRRLGVGIVKETDEKNLLRDDFLPHIQALPNLGRISLAIAYVGERLDFIEGFQKLKFLIIRRCLRLKEIVINEGVMPGLQRLTITGCQEFTALPPGWESLHDLNKVVLYDVSPGLTEKIWKSKRMDQRTIRGIMLSRQEGSEAIFNITCSWFV